MIEKLVALPVKAGYNMGKFGIGKGAEAGIRIIPAIRDYLIPAVKSADDIDYYSRITSRKKNRDIRKHIAANPEKKNSLEECISRTVDENYDTRQLAAIIDTVDKAAVPIGLAASYSFFMTGKYTLGLVKEVIEFALLKGPFMAHYAKKNGLGKIPGWLAYEFLSYALPGGSILDLWNTYVRRVDKDIETQAANLFREKEGLKQPTGWLHGMWNTVKGYFSPTPSKQPEVPVAVEAPVVPLPDPDKKTPLIPLPRYDPRDEAPVVPLPTPDLKEDQVYVDEKGLIHVFLNGKEKVYNCNGILGPVAPGTYPNGKYELMAKPTEQNIEQKAAA